MTQFSLARLYIDQQRYALAELIYTRVLRTSTGSARRQPGMHAPRVTPTGGLLQHVSAGSPQSGSSGTAPRSCTSRALKKYLEEVSRPDGFEFARTLNDLAELYRGQRRLADAQPLYKRAVAICANGDMSPDHELVRTVLASLAALWEDQGRAPVRPSS